MPVIRVLLLLSILFPSFVSGDAFSIKNDSLIDNKKIGDMLKWIEANSRYKVISTDVDLRFANSEFIKKEWKETGGNPDKDIAALTTVLVPSRHIIIYMPIDFDWNNPIHLTFLLHELVHFQQYTYRIDINPKCEDFMEFEAYVLALLWYSNQGYSNVDFMNDRLRKIDSVATCS